MSQYLELTFNNFTYKSKIACFDLDGTLIKTISKKIHPIDENDWEFNYDIKIKDKLLNLIKNNYCIIIISNQKGLIKRNQLENWKNKINHINNQLQIPLKVFASLYDDIFRKPNPGLWNLISKNITPDYNNSFYCGDAIGRIGDFSDCDFKFAKNQGLLFYSPEQMFLDNNYKYENNIEYFKFKENKENNINYNYKNSKELIILVGFPGSGKSTIANKYKSDFQILNSDSYKNKNKLLKDFEKLILADKNIIIDNTNPSIEARKYYIDIAKKHNYNITCFNMTTPILLAKHNNYYRYLYENKELVPNLVYNIYNKKYIKPEISEGFNLIIDICSNYKTEKEYFNYLF